MNHSEALQAKVPPIHRSAARGVSSQRPSRRRHGFFGYLAVLLLTFSTQLIALALHAGRSQIHSYILLVPFVSIYLYRQVKTRPSVALASSVIPAIAAFILATGSLAAALVIGTELGENDHFTLISLSFVLFFWAGCFLFFGWRWISSALFPVAFLIFMVPLPDAVVNSLETASQFASADAASYFFGLAGMPIFRQGNVFQLPGITIQVAQECSGIHSSLVLFITSLIASHMFLRTTWRRVLLVALVIPLGVLRNGFRILVIGELCMRLGPDMIHSPIHRQGGPLFFILSLFPLFLLLWWLHRREGARDAVSFARTA